MRAARDDGKKCVFQQACEGGDLELPEAVRRHAPLAVRSLGNGTWMPVVAVVTGM